MLCRCKVEFAAEKRVDPMTCPHDLARFPVLQMVPVLSICSGPVSCPCPVTTVKGEMNLLLMTVLLPSPDLSIPGVFRIKCPRQNILTTVHATEVP